MGISIFKTATSKTEQMDIKSSFNVWNTLKEGYKGVNDTQMLLNFIHDMDLKSLVDRLLKGRLNQVKLLEQELITFNLEAPDRPALDINTSVKLNEMTDKFVFKQILSAILNDLYSLALTVRTTLTADRLRQLFTDFLLAELKQYNQFFQYGKMKGWNSIEPSYKIPKPQNTEELSTADAFHIWDHLRVRYYNIQLTEFFQGYAHDVDFKAGMALADRTLHKQIKKLEQMALRYEIPLPERPPAAMKTAIDPEIMQDKFMFQQLFLGIDNMVDIHMRAVLEMSRNDDARDYFIKLFREELDIHDSMIRYGKMKGWLQVPPVYSQGVNA